MDKLTALHVLGLRADVTRNEIKQAYAELSKKYHPEEYPAEFQQIHEAYRVLSRIARQNPEPQYYFTNQESQEDEKEAAEEETEFDFQKVYKQNHEKQQEPKEAEEETEFDFRKVYRQNQEEKQEPPKEEGRDYHFESVFETAGQKEQEKLHEAVLKALAEMNILLQPNYCEKVKLFQAFFEKEEYQEALHQPEFLQEFAKMLHRVTLKKAIYHKIISYYHLKNADVEKLNPSQLLFYKTINEKCNINKPATHLWIGAIPIVAIWVIRIGMKNSVRNNFTILGILALLVIIAGYIIWGYRKLHENHSSIFAQMIIAFVLGVSHFLIVGIDLYGKLCGDLEAGAMLASLVCVGSAMWLMVLIGIAAIKMVIRKIKR